MKGVDLKMQGYPLTLAYDERRLVYCTFVDIKTGAKKTLDYNYLRGWIRQGALQVYGMGTQRDYVYISGAVKERHYRVDRFDGLDCYQYLVARDIVLHNNKAFLYMNMYSNEYRADFYDLYMSRKDSVHTFLRGIGRFNGDINDIEGMRTAIESVPIINANIVIRDKRYTMEKIRN